MKCSSFLQKVRKKSVFIKDVNQQTLISVSALVVIVFASRSVNNCNFMHGEA